nr:DNA polymerase III subunit gamma and tau [Herbiconiux solani]
MIGQSQVTDPLMTALRTNRVNHAYLFSGPRGCGKTTSARILARCLNCAEGPTDTPCGVCPSCVELGRDGPGSLDVVEIDAASHNGVDDARDLRERAVFAPARDRFKIFILDEAHMVTPQGFNALLKIVEEPPEHIKFIFATTEPDKVIGTIRSRTHHYPFRLIPPAQLLEYVQHLCETEGVEVAPGVLPLVVRAGGGSARDTLSLLDQLIAGSENNRVEYERAVALLGYTHGALLSEAIDALGAHDGAAVFDAVDRVIQTGQDPRRFVEDLLERLRDIIVVAATREQASSVLRGVPADEIEVMRRQAALFGHAELSRVADIVNSALSEMTGATSPRLHLELMVARALVPASDDTQRGALARVERLERRIGVDSPDAGVASFAAHHSAATQDAPPRQTAPAAGATSGALAGAGAGAGAIATGGAGATDRSVGSAAPGAAAGSVTGSQAEATSGSPEKVDSGPAESATSGADSSGGAGIATPDVVAVPASAVPVATPPAAAAEAAGEVTLQQLKDAWPEILEAVQKAKMTAWLVVFTAQVRSLDGDVLTLAFPSENDVASFKERSAPGQGVSEFLRQAILDVLGLRVKYIARVDTTLRPHDSDAPDARPAASAPDTVAPTSGANASAAPAADASAPAAPAAGTSAPAGPAAGANAPAAATAGASAPAAPATAAPEPAPAAPRRPPVDASGWAVPGLATEPETPAVVESTPAQGGHASQGGTEAKSSGSSAAQVQAPPVRQERRNAAPTKSSGSAGAKAAAPTTSWDVVAIPTSSGDDDDVPLADEPMPSDEPELPADRAESIPSAGSSRNDSTIAADPTRAPETAGDGAQTGDGPRAGSAAGRPSAAGSAAGRTPGGDPAARPGALRFEAQPEAAGAPAAQSAPRTPATPAPTVGGRLRYGEAVVREILGANFIEEQPLPGREG